MAKEEFVKLISAFPGPGGIFSLVFPAEGPSPREKKTPQAHPFERAWGD